MIKSVTNFGHAFSVQFLTDTTLKSDPKKGLQVAFESRMCIWLCALLCAFEHHNLNRSGKNVGIGEGESSLPRFIVGLIELDDKNTRIGFFDHAAADNTLFAPAFCGQLNSAADIAFQTFFNLIQLIFFCHFLSPHFL